MYTSFLYFFTYYCYLWFESCRRTSLPTFIFYIYLYLSPRVPDLTITNKIKNLTTTPVPISDIMRNMENPPERNRRPVELWRLMKITALRVLVIIVTLIQVDPSSTHTLLSTPGGYRDLRLFPLLNRSHHKSLGILPSRSFSEYIIRRRLDRGFLEVEDHKCRSTLGEGSLYPTWVSELRLFILYHLTKGSNPMFSHT